LSSTPGTPPADVDRFLLTAVGRTDVGLQRSENEDAFYIDDELGLYLVCDGMGGHASGQIASDLAVRTIVHHIASGEASAASAGEPLSAAIAAANGAVYQRGTTDPGCRGMGTTVVGIRADGDLLHICHVGDSRVYLLREGQLVQLTRDHSLENLYREKPELRGQLGPASSNVIVRAIGLEQQVEVDHRVMAMQDRDVYLLCCDGLTDMVEAWMIREIMTAAENLDEVADNLVRAANANGGADNITVICLALLAENQAPAEEPPQHKTFPGVGTFRRGE
jgi:serine/threonine protein phosphatase PrpC